MNSNAMGIIFPNSYDALVPDLTRDRLMASIPFAGRYRMIDFVLSGMVNAGIDNISVIVRENYLSLMDHLGSGRAWDLTRKKGGLNIVPPYARKDSKVYSGKVDALASILSYLKEKKEKYVVLADSHIAANFNFKDMINQHVKSGADITVAYEERTIPADLLNTDKVSKGLYYSFSLEGQKVTKMMINSKEEGITNLGLNLYVIKRTLLIDLVTKAYVEGKSFFERDILNPNIDVLDVQGYKCTDYTARITGMRSYFEENMKLLEDENLDQLFVSKRPIYTKVRDDNPTRYIKGATVKNVMAADGCAIEGHVENCVLFKGVHIEEGAVVRNCVIMQDTVIKSGANIEYIVADKDVTIGSNVEMRGSLSFPIYIAKKKNV